MSNITLASLRDITRESLSQRILSSPSGALPENVAIIDVRDGDYIGGHIRGSTHVPSSELDYKMPELVRTLMDKEIVVFHCALSQQRGPKAALSYLREKRRLDPDSKTESKGEVTEGGEEAGDRQEKKLKEPQKVLVLEGGFTKWQEKYGEDTRLTEGYRKDIWEFGS